ncbi:MAG: response regulator [Anaerolineae bacterium]
MQNLTYVYVEDDPMSREALSLILKRVMKLEHVHIFEDSTDFMTRVSALSTVPDIFLLDIHMHPHSGFEMLAMLRADDRYRASRIIALTASVMNEEIDLLKTSGFDGVIGKPINVPTFPKILGRITHGETIWHITDIDG